MTLRSHGGREGFERDGREPVQVALLDARRRAWAPLALRAVAVGLALVGLAGIGSVAGRAPSSSALAPGVGSSAQLAQLGAVDRGIGFLAAPPPNEGRPVTSGAAAREPSAAADTAVETMSPSGGPPCPCAADATGEPPPVPRAISPGPPRLSSAARPRPHALERDVRLAPAASTAAPATTADGRVAINRATVSELMLLPGVGAKRAAAIVEQRQRLGRFREASELLRIKGIGPRTLERLLPRLILD